MTDTLRSRFGQRRTALNRGLGRGVPDRTPEEAAEVRRADLTERIVAAHADGHYALVVEIADQLYAIPRASGLGREASDLDTLAATLDREAADMDAQSVAAGESAQAHAKDRSQLVAMVSDGSSGDRERAIAEIDAEAAAERRELEEQITNTTKADSPDAVAALRQQLRDLVETQKIEIARKRGEAERAIEERAQAAIAAFNAKADALAADASALAERATEARRAAAGHRKRAGQIRARVPAVQDVSALVSDAIRRIERADDLLSGEATASGALEAIGMMPNCRKTRARAADVFAGGLVFELKQATTPAECATVERLARELIKTTSASSREGSPLHRVWTEARRLRIAMEARDTL
jgi:hypothetical protein